MKSQKQKRIQKRIDKVKRKKNEAVENNIQGFKRPHTQYIGHKKAQRLSNRQENLEKKYKEAGEAKRRVYKYGVGGENLQNGKVRQVVKDNIIKKTVTRTPGGVEKEIERGNKRIEVRKYKDEGIKSRTVTNMKKNEQYQNDLKNSTFNRFPKQMFDNANSSQNTQIDGEISESKPLTTPQKKLMNVPYKMLKGTLDKMSTEGGFKTTPKTGHTKKEKD